MKTTSFLSAVLLALTVSASPIVERQATSASSEVDSAVSSSSTQAPNATSSGAMPTATAVAGEGDDSSTGNATTPAAQALNDTQILQFALTLEHLEAAFYNASIGMFSEQDFESAGFNASTRDQLYSIGQDEAQHVAFLTTALGNSSVSPCEYDLSSVTDIPSFLATAQVLEGVGVSAYLGAAKLIMDKTYLEAAGSILTVESRHQSYINSQVNTSANVIPAAFDTPLNATEVYSLAAPFIKSCPDNSTLPFKAFPVATIALVSADVASEDTNSTEASSTMTAVASSATGAPANATETDASSASDDDSDDDSTSTSTSSAMSSGSTSASTAQPMSTLITPGSQVSIKYDAAMTQSQDGNNASTLYVAIISGPTAPVFMELPEDGSITLPAEMSGGQFYAVVTSSNSTVSDDTALAIGAGQVSIPLPKAPAATVSSAVSSATETGVASSGVSSASSQPTESASDAEDGSSATESLVGSASAIITSLASAPTM